MSKSFEPPMPWLRRAWLREIGIEHIWMREVPARVAGAQAAPPDAARASQPSATVSLVACAYAAPSGSGAGNDWRVVTEAEAYAASPEHRVFLDNMMRAFGAVMRGKPEVFKVAPHADGGVLSDLVTQESPGGGPRRILLLGETAAALYRELAARSGAAAPMLAMPDIAAIMADAAGKAAAWRRLCEFVSA